MRLMICLSLIFLTGCASFKLDRDSHGAIIGGSTRGNISASGEQTDGSKFNMDSKYSNLFMGIINYNKATL